MKNKIYTFKSNLLKVISKINDFIYRFNFFITTVYVYSYTFLSKSPRN